MSEEQTPAITAMWQKVLEKTDGIIHKDAVKKFILPIVPVSLEKNEFVLAVKEAFTKGFIESRYGALLGDVIQQALGTGYTFRLIVDPDAAASKKEKPAKEEKEPPVEKTEAAGEEPIPAQGSLPLTQGGDTNAAAPDDASSLHPKYPFDAFVMGRSNQFS